MVNSAIRLKKYFFPIVDIRANIKHKPDEDKNILFDIESATVKLDEKGNNYQLVIDIKISEEDSENIPYAGQIQAVGFFSLDNTISKEESKNLLHDQGIGNLYAAIREFILMITGRGPWGPLGLPIHDPKEIELQEITPENNLDSTK